jgi:hypothetical protein
MHSRSVEFEVFDTVAFITDLISLLLQEKLADDAVPKVAIFAFLVFGGFVNIRHRTIFLDVFFVTIQALFAFEFAFLRIRSGREARQHDAEAEQARPHAHQSPALI